MTQFGRCVPARRWDRAHLHEFRLADGTRLTTPYRDDDELGTAIDDRRAKLSRLRPGDHLVYTFDLGDGWRHLCTVGSERIDPAEELGIVPAVPLPYFGWGDMPDQYGRRWDADDGEGPVPEDPGVPDVPGLLTRRTSISRPGPARTARTLEHGFRDFVSPGVRGRDAGPGEPK